MTKVLNIIMSIENGGHDPEVHVAITDRFELLQPIARIAGNLVDRVLSTKIVEKTISSLLALDDDLFNSQRDATRNLPPNKHK